MTSEELKAKRRAILINYMNKPEVLVELKEIKEYLMVASKKELKYNPDIRLVEAIDKLSQLLKEIPEIEKNIRPIVKIVSPDKMSIDWEKVPDDMKPKDFVKIDWKNMPVKDKVEVDGLSETLDKSLDKSLEKLITKNEMPNEAIMVIGPNNLWESVTINYPNEKIKVDIDRNRNDVIRRLTFSKE